MRDRGIDRDHEVDEGKHSRGIGEIVKLGADLRDPCFAGEQSGIFVAQLALKPGELWIPRGDDLDLLVASRGGHPVINHNGMDPG